MDQDALASIARHLNAVPATAERTARLTPLVIETNEILRAAGDALVTLDSTPLSFQALKAAHETPA